MDDLKLIVKSEEELYKQLKLSVIIFIWNLDLKNVPRLHSKRQTSSLAKFSDQHQQRNTRARTGKNIQVPQD